MQITTTTGRTVEIYANTEAGITYRNVKDGKAYGATRSADRATAKAGSVGREILDALDAQAATEVAEVAPVTGTTPAAKVATPVATPVATEAPAPAKGTAVFKADGRWGTVLDGVVMTGRRKGHPGFGRRYVSVLWTTAENGAPRPSYGFVYLDEIIRIVAAPSARETVSDTTLAPLDRPMAGTGREARSEVQKRVRAALIRNAVGLRFE